jgi:MiaB-like tRNA modifying enzyme
MKIFFKTFGCRTNIYDTAIMQSHLKDAIVIEDEADADIIIVNSCTVTNSADANVRSYINKFAQSDKKIILAGCGSFSKGEELFAQKKIFGVLGHSQKANIAHWSKSKERFFELGDLKSIDETIIEDFQGKSKAFVKVQEGCDFRCSYCIIPSVRGNARSLDERLILKQIEILASNGYGEFVLTGTNLGSYGKDTKSSLARLLQKISQLRGVRRIRLGSLEPVQIDDTFEEILEESWLERHLHIALQHTSKEMLLRMRRRNSLQSDLDLFERLSEKGYALGTDFIVGHPGESDEIFEEALKNFQKFPLTHLHAFTYSKRDGTHSASMSDTVAPQKAKQRMDILQQIIQDKNYAFRQNNPNPLQVLVEEQKGDSYVGYDQFFNKIHIQSDLPILKDWVEIKEYTITPKGNYAKI